MTSSVLGIFLILRSALEGRVGRGWDEGQKFMTWEVSTVL